MIQNLRHITLVFLVLLSMPYSCVERIDLPPPAGLTEAVVIQGRLVMGENSRIEITTTRLFDFSAESKLALNVKEAILRDDEGNEMEIVPLFKGVFNTPLDENSPIQLQVGKSYALEITTLDNRTYRSSFDVLTDNPAPKSMTFGEAEAFAPSATGSLSRIKQLETFIDAEITENRGGLLWEVTRTYRLTDTPLDSPPKTCYLTSVFSLETIPTFSSENPILLNNYSLGKQILDFRASEGMYINVNQLSLSPEASDYWAAVSSLAKKEGDLFDEPVGLIPTNFENINDPDEEVFGYFFATTEKQIRQRVPEELVRDIPRPCPPINPPQDLGNQCNLGVCCDCLDGPQATLTRPDFWID